MKTNPASPFVATHVMRAGWGYHRSDGNFGRAPTDTPVRIARDEYARSNCSVVYTEKGERWHVDNRALIPTGNEPAPTMILARQAT